MVLVSFHLVVNVDDVHPGVSIFNMCKSMHQSFANIFVYIPPKFFQHLCSAEFCPKQKLIFTHCYPCHSDFLNYFILVFADRIVILPATRLLEARHTLLNLTLRGSGGQGIKNPSEIEVIATTLSRRL